MTSKLLLSIVAVVVALPVVLWAVFSLFLTGFSVIRQPTSLSFRFYTGESVSPAFHFRELPVWLSVCILVAAGLLARSIFSSSR